MPLVVGAPRTGFTLLITLARSFYRFADHQSPSHLTVLRYFVDNLGEHLSRTIIATFADNGITDDLVFSPMFYPLIGGPKWIWEEDPRFACIRKYIGVRGMGDFTLIVKLPRKLMECDTVVHSHTHPSIWSNLPDFQKHTKFAAVRNPCGALNSAVFSINAISSQYIQLFISPENDNDQLRQHIAKFKLTNLEFFKGITDFYSDYLQEFIDCRNHFILMRWEDLIQNPQKTILALAHSAGVPLKKWQAAIIWRRMRYRNLTGPHRHNFRKGKGIVGDWKTSLVNEHLDIIKQSGVEPLMEELGYGPIEYLKESGYTAYQKEIAAFIRRGEVFDDYPDRDLFIFDFQKSNIKWDGLLSFQSYPWKPWTKIERSAFQQEDLLLKVLEAADRAVGRVSVVLNDVLDEDWRDPGDFPKLMERLETRHANTLANLEDGRYRHIFRDANRLKLLPQMQCRAVPVFASIPPYPIQNCTLYFVRDDTDAIGGVLSQYLKHGAVRVLFRPFNSRCLEILNSLRQLDTRASFFALAAECEVPAPDTVLAMDFMEKADVVVIAARSSEAVSSLLIDCIELKQGVVIAPTTDRFWNKGPLFLVSPQKAGTHLLFELARSLGYDDGLVLSDPPKGGHWYFLEYSNAHTSARDFFIDAVRRATFGNRRHPFRTSPTLFMYRHPLDILVSEAFYYHRDGHTAFCGYLSELDFGERLLRLVNDPWLLGSIRDRIGGFLAWIDFPSVIPISFEELVGSRGGGDDDLLEKLVWSLQLKLHVPGIPKDIAARVFNKESPTFRKGSINGYREHLTAAAYLEFSKLPQDFMEILGYSTDVQQDTSPFSRRIEEFRQRPLKLGKETHRSTSIAVEFNFLGYDLIVYQGTYYAVPIHQGIDLERSSPRALGNLLSANDPTSLKQRIIKTIKNEGMFSAMFRSMRSNAMLIRPLKFIKKVKAATKGNSAL